MAQEHLLPLIERFLADTGMSASYFGEKSVRNSKLVPRLRQGRPIQIDTDRRLRAFMSDEMARRKAAARRLLRRDVQPPATAAPSDLPQVVSPAGA